jgi:hypothetical protein
MPEVEDLKEKDKKLKADLDFIINKSYSAASKYFSDRENNRIRFESIDTSLKTKKEKWQAKYVSPFPAFSVEQKACYLTEALTSLGPDFIQYMPFDNLEAEDQSQVLTKLIAYYLTNTNTIEKVYLYSKDLLIYGTAVARIFYDYETRMVKKNRGKKLTLIDNQFAEVDDITETEVVDRDMPNFENVRLHNFWVDDECPDNTMDSMRQIILRELITFKKIEAYEESWGLRNLEIAKKTGIPSRDFGKMSNDRSNNMRRQRTADYDVEQIVKLNESGRKDNPICELLTIYTPGKVQLVLNGIPISDKMVIYDNIRYPFIVSRNQPINGEFWGRSDMDIIENNIKFHEEMTNLIKDNYTEHLRPIRLIDMSLGQEAIKRLQSAQPGAQIAVPDVNGVVELRPTSFDSSAVPYAAGFLDEAKTSMAINPLMEGENPGSGIRSEGSLELYQQIGSTRMSVLVNILAAAFMQMGKMYVQLVKQFGAEDISLIVTGKLNEATKLALRPVDLPDNVQVKVMLSTVADAKRAQRVASMLQLVSAAVQMDDMKLFRKERAMVEVFIESRLFEDGKEFYETDPNILIARATLAAQAAGNQSPTVTGGLVPPQGAAPQQPAPQQSAPAEAPESQMPTSSPQRPAEGNPQGVNQFSMAGQ